MMRENEAIWKHFMVSYVSIVHEKTLFARNSRVQLVLAFTSTSDEVFALLVIECNYERWSEIFQRRQEGRTDEKDLPDPRYILKSGAGWTYWGISVMHLCSNW